MTNIFIIVALLILFFFIIQKYVVKQDNSKDYAYRVKGPVLRSQEVAFFNALKTAVGEHGVVFSKVNMSSVIAPRDIVSKKQLFIASNKISRSHFDYLICDPRTFEPRVVIELDNGKELNKSKVEREKLLMQVCKSANIPLIGTSVKHSYQVGRLRRLLAAHIDLIEPDKEIRFCKKCGSPMVIKVASQGEFKGRRFFTCSRQPNCTYTENYNVVFDTDDDE
ncbi:hypothetical protein BOO30_02715 [Vibrio navarrensis]|jgi:hypothetical protein|uniref:DUF2726 domain-containing protein n=1 Tax=Vibrio navarrensis TaxID=29495 RepID=A0AAI9G947_9VIBR|nr:DUF2726 domain-containing protein [Vibrio navarrensis]EGR2795465.1 DUF2726 domain-containing protein [Vibrio navarrensis]EHA1126133.1 DUF2726 domain-containing protein [Vibrio navarrensis]EJL6395020.1 DUF2726 domain-containing protein [Vibrio navarrensis]EJL6399195.1 DUF2726 domain-containing protein [Vibrio navarrensis]EJL6564891.1 DUF2726 domain-containing protein [Vibrio navarrensis]